MVKKTQLDGKKNLIKDGKKELKKDVPGKKNFIKKISSLKEINNFYSLVGIIGFFGTVIVVCLNFISFIGLKTHFDYYGLNLDLISSGLNYLIYYLCIFCSIIILFFSVVYLMIFLLYKDRSDLSWKDNVCDLLAFIFYILSINFIFYIMIKMFYLSFSLSFTDIDIYVYFSKWLVPFEISVSIIGYIFSKIFKIDIIKWGLNIHNKFLRVVLGSIFIICFFILISGVYKTILDMKEKYYLTDDNSSVIVYSTESYYLTLDCEVRFENGEKVLVIFSNTQNKISSNNVRTKYNTFDRTKFEDIIDNSS